MSNDNALPQNLPPITTTDTSSVDSQKKTEKERMQGHDFSKEPGDKGISKGSKVTLPEKLPVHPDADSIDVPPHMPRALAFLLKNRKVTPKSSEATPVKVTIASQEQSKTTTAVAKEVLNMPKGPEPPPTPKPPEIPVNTSMMPKSLAVLFQNRKVPAKPSEAGETVAPSSTPAQHKVTVLTTPTVQAKPETTSTTIDFAIKLFDLTDMGIQDGYYLARNEKGKLYYSDNQDDALTPVQIKEESLKCAKELEEKIANSKDTEEKEKYLKIYKNLMAGLFGYFKINPNPEIKKLVIELNKNFTALTNKLLDEIRENIKKVEEDTQKSEENIKVLQSHSEKVMRLFHAHLDSRLVELPAIQSLSSLDANQSLLTDLQEYQKEGSTSPTINAATKEMEFATEIEKEVYQINTDDKLPQIPKISEKIVAAAKELPIPIPGGPKSCVLISGGYVNPGKSGHAVMYQIERESADKFKFTIINTGEGSEVALKKGGLRSVDIVYTGVSAEKLANVLEKLLEFQTPIKAKKLDPDMEKLKKTVSDHFLQTGPNGVSNKSSGKTHRIQETNSCTVRCGLSWLHERIGRQEYKKFRPGSMQRKMDAAKKDYDAFKHRHDWKKETFGTTDDAAIKRTCEQMFRYMENNIRSLKGEQQDWQI